MKTKGSFFSALGLILSMVSGTISSEQVPLLAQTSGSCSSGTPYSIKSGDTLYLVAQTQLGNGDLWPQIKNPNGSSPEPYNLIVGQLVCLPQQIPQQSDVRAVWVYTTTQKPNLVSSPTLSIALSGWADPEQARQNSTYLKPELVGQQYITVGGGADISGRLAPGTAGWFTQARLQRTIADINNGVFSGYQGIAFDIEGGDSGLASLFSQAFAAAHQKGLKVLVTVSHSSPYAVSDAATLMSGFFTDSNIDYLSPQLYTSGNETQNDYTDSTVPWTNYAGAKAAIIPSITLNAFNQNGAQNAKNFFAQKGVNTHGYIVWPGS